MPCVTDNRKGKVLRMINCKEELKNNIISEQMVIAALVTCESIISKKAYMEKKWSNHYEVSNQSYGDTYKAERIQWMEYRKKLQTLLLPKYSMKEIIRIAKGSKGKSTQTDVIRIVEIVDSGNYKFM